MKKTLYIIRDIAITVGIQLVCFMVCLWIQNSTVENALIPAVSIFGVFLTSVITPGYLYGVAAAILSVLELNFAFTFPFFHFNFSIPENMASAVIIILMALITCGFTTKIKYNKILEEEREKEKIRADIFRAVSHDLRTPLTTIYGSSSALLDPDNDFTKEQRTKMLQDIQQDAQWLFRMVENLLSITKLDSGKVKIIKTPTVLDELIDSVILKFHKRYPDQEVEIDIPDEFVVIPMDAILIQQVLINILENAVQHAKGMGSAAVRR